MVDKRSRKSKKKPAVKQGPRPRPLQGLTNARILPDRLRIVAPYSEYLTLSPAAGNWTSQAYRGNDVYDPDLTGVGTTARMFTALNTLYGKHRVLSSRFSLDAVNSGATAIGLVLVATTNNVAGATMEDILANRHIHKRMLSPATGSSSYTHRAQASTSKILGVPQTTVLSEDNFAGIAGASPTNAWYWIVVADNKTSAGAGSIVMEVRIEYEVVWESPLNLPS